MTSRSLNPAELKIDLLCNGLRTEGASGIDRESQRLPNSLAGLGSGLELVLPGEPRDVWVNAPVAEHFVAMTPFRLEGSRSAFAVRDERDGSRYPVRLAASPGWYGMRTERGIPMSHVAMLHGTCLFVLVGDRCQFWSSPEDQNCSFCSTGLEAGWQDRAEVTVEDVVETALRAKTESAITFILLHSGYQGSGGLRKAFPYLRALKERVGILVGIQFIPEHDLSLYDEAQALGVDHLSFSVEFFNAEYLQRYAPGKASVVGRKQFFRVLEHCARRLGKGRVSAEIIAGVEPLRDTLRAVDYIGCIGALPLVCIFRPLLGTAMEREPPPRFQDMLRVFRRVYHTCRLHHLPIGVAPNVNWSLSLQPEDTLYLAQDTAWDSIYRRWIWTMRWLMKPYFQRQVRAQIAGDRDI